MKFRFLIFIFFLASHFFAFAQDQECIMYFNDGTSIEGFGKLEVVGKYDIREKIKFRLTKEEEEGDYWDFDDVSKITFIGFEMKKTFEYVKIKEREYPQLLELLVDGEVKLYKFFERTRFLNWFNSNPTKYNATVSQNQEVTFTPEKNSTLPFPNRNEEVRDEHYLIRETEEIATCIDCSVLKSWAKNVSNYLADYDTLVRDLKNHKYSFAELEDAIINYNDICVD